MAASKPKRIRCVPSKYPKKGGLESGWRTWDRFLSEYVDKPVNIIEIGVYEGKASAWYLNNIMTNKKSHLYAVDTFKGSPEYQGKIDFKEVKRKFKEAVVASGKKDQVTLMEMTSEKALLKLLSKKDDKKIMFDIIFIDASHESRDVIFDGVLAWKLLKNGGTLIFDDYKWTKMKQHYFRPKMAIDAMMQIYEPEMDVLSIKYQVLVRKKQLEDYIKPDVDTTQKIQ